MATHIKLHAHMHTCIHHEIHSHVACPQVCIILSVPVAARLQRPALCQTSLSSLQLAARHAGLHRAALSQPSPPSLIVVLGLVVPSLSSCKHIHTNIITKTHNCTPGKIHAPKTNPFTYVMVLGSFETSKHGNQNGNRSHFDLERSASLLGSQRPAMR